jgi:hypothetical protein
MSKQFPCIDDTLRNFIGRQHVFFTASAAAGARVNVSPRDGASLRVIDANTVAYLDRTGSGNETAAHLRADGRLTLMFCAFEGPPMILRLYGTGRALARGSEEFQRLLAAHFDSHQPPGTRQMYVLAIDLVQTSCGYGVPQFDYRAERRGLERWAESKGEDGLRAYQQEKNTLSIDGLPTGLFEPV